MVSFALTFLTVQGAKVVIIYYLTIYYLQFIYYLANFQLNNVENLFFLTF